MTDSTLQKLSDELIRDVLYRLNDECLVRINLCLDKLTEEQVWWRPNEESNSIGNLILHLCGNVSQWILTGLGSQEDTRRRQEEFDTRDPVPVEVLRIRLGEVLAEATKVISEQSPDDLLRKRPVQTFEESGVSILVHVAEHFSYHTGQIAWITKMLTADQLGFYANVPLE